MPLIQDTAYPRLAASPGMAELAGWWPLVTGQNGRDPTPTTVDRRAFELCLFTQVMNDLRSGDLCIPGSDAYGDHRSQLVPWETYDREIAAYTEQAHPRGWSPRCASGWRRRRRPSMPLSPTTSTSRSSTASRS